MNKSANLMPLQPEITSAKQTYIKLAQKASDTGHTWGLPGNCNEFVYIPQPIATSDD